MHGYQIMGEITERSGGVWHPSPGSVYPTLQALEDEGLVTATTADGRRVFQLTEEGRSVAENRRPTGAVGAGLAAGRRIASRSRRARGRRRPSDGPDGTSRHSGAGGRSGRRHGPARRPDVATDLVLAAAPGRA